MLGWHVHEKAILPTIILAGMLVPLSMEDAKLFFLLSLSGTVGLFPLLFTARDVITEFLLSIVYFVLAWNALNYSSNGSFVDSFRLMDWIVIGLILLACAFAYGFCPIFLKYFSECLFNRNLPFLPLMTISVSCALSNCYIVLLSVKQLVKRKMD